MMETIAYKLGLLIGSIRKCERCDLLEIYIKWLSKQGAGHEVMSNIHGWRLSYGVYKEGTELRNAAGLTDVYIKTEEEFNAMMAEQEIQWLPNQDTFYVS